ncbi:uncharacterized protein LOC134539894 [Bacillus rossius redtenbacheri]|uniref:uncharacterized protein LOC134539894 n=1 Tax=Bacillus rossius redtenbacheri TaxID=93214 RepID=UPI002FDEC086
MDGCLAALRAEAEALMARHQLLRSALLSSCAPEDLQRCADCSQLFRDALQESSQEGLEQQLSGLQHAAALERLDRSRLEARLEWWRRLCERQAGELEAVSQGVAVVRREVLRVVGPALGWTGPSGGLARLQDYSQQVNSLETQNCIMESGVKSLSSELQATKEKLESCENEKAQVLKTLEQRNEDIRNLKVANASLESERNKHLDALAKLDSKLKKVCSCFDKELELKGEVIEKLRDELGKLEKDRERLISMNDEVADEVMEWQAMIRSLCHLVNQVSQQALAKVSAAVETPGVTRVPRVRVLISSRELKSSLSLLSCSREEGSRTSTSSQVAQISPRGTVPGEEVSRTFTSSQIAQTSPGGADPGEEGIRTATSSQVAQTSPGGTGRGEESSRTSTSSQVAQTSTEGAGPHEEGIRTFTSSQIAQTSPGGTGRGEEVSRTSTSFQVTHTSPGGSGLREEGNRTFTSSQVAQTSVGGSCLREFASTVTRTEQSQQICVCVGDDSVVTSAVNMVEDIKAQLKAYVLEETRKRSVQQNAIAKMVKTESKLKRKCRELEKTRLELKDSNNKSNLIEQDLQELKKKNKLLISELKNADDVIERMKQEKSDLSSEIKILEGEVMKGLQTIRSQCDSMKNLESTIEELNSTITRQCNTMIDLENTIDVLKEMLLSESDTSIETKAESAELNQETHLTINITGIPAAENTPEAPVEEIPEEKTELTQRDRATTGDSACEYQTVTSELEDRIQQLDLTQGELVTTGDGACEYQTVTSELEGRIQQLDLTQRDLVTSGDGACEYQMASGDLEGQIQHLDLTQRDLVTTGDGACEYQMASGELEGRIQRLELTQRDPVTTGDGACEYQTTTGELEGRIQRLELTHKSEIEEITRVHIENMTAFEAAFERDKASDRKMYDELLLKQQELHEQEIQSLNVKHEEELWFLRSLLEPEHSGKEVLTSEDSVEDVYLNLSRTKEGGSGRCLKEVLQKDDGSSGAEPAASEPRTERASRRAELSRPMGDSSAQDNNSLERLKTMNSFRTKQENQKPRATKNKILTLVTGSLSVAPTEVLEYKPPAGDQLFAGDPRGLERLQQSGAILLDEVSAQMLRHLVHNGPEALAPEQWSALQGALCPAPSSLTSLDGRRDASSRSLFRSASYGLADDAYLRDCTAESSVDGKRKKSPVDSQWRFSDRPHRSGPAYFSHVTGIAMASSRSDVTARTLHRGPRSAAAAAAAAATSASLTRAESHP